MGQRQALNVTFAWMVSRHPREMEAAQKINEMLSATADEFAGVAVSDLSEDSIESLLDSL